MLRLAGVIEVFRTQSFTTIEGAIGEQGNAVGVFI